MDKFISNELEIEEVDSGIHKLLWRPHTYIRKFPGKRVRNTFIKAISHWLTDMPPNVLKRVEKIWKRYHEVALLLDDIQDNSALRRGAPAAYTVFGVAGTVLAVDALVMEIYYELLQLKGLKSWKIGLEQGLLALQGQGIELYWTRKTICPTEEEFLNMISKKTAAAFVLVSKLLELFYPNDLHNLMELFGRYFQIRDDYQNLKSEVYFKEKGFGEDITEGKFGFPTVHACNNYPEVAPTLKEILGSHTYDVERKKQFIEILEKCGSFEYTRNILDKMEILIYEAIEKKGRNKAVEELLAMIGYSSSSSSGF